MNRFILLLVSFSVVVLIRAPLLAQAQDKNKALSESLLFYASFDQGVHADFAKGDPHMLHAADMDKRDTAQQGLPLTGNVVLKPNEGRFGGALRFNKEAGPIVFYPVKANFPEPTVSWSGTLSFWLNTDPKGELKDGFCDPIQITSKQWDDAAFFVEFEKRATGIPFRLGVYADKNVWNPTGRAFETIPANERPLITVENPPFSVGKWTHVVVTFDKFNSEGTDSMATLYLDGLPAGQLSGRKQVFTWNIDKAAMMLGLSYVGMMDELSAFKSALTAEEVKQLYSLENGVSDIVLRTNHP